MTDKDTLKRLCDDLEGIEMSTEDRALQRYSKDFSWFSPVLAEQLRDKKAELVVKPASEDQVKSVVAACKRHSIPLTLRGSGTGNYGQSTPLYGGVLMDMSGLNRILWIKNGVARVQAGAILLEIDKAAREQGCELRLMPSTYRQATAGGFYCGGFGGVGSITYGSIGDPGNVIGLRVMSMAEEPELIELRGAEARALYHAYGANGLITELELALAPALDWQENLLSFNDFMQAVKFCQALGSNCGTMKKLLTVLANPLPQMCGLGQQIAPGHTAVVCIINRSGIDVMHELCDRFSGELVGEQSHAEVFGTTKSFIEYSWNHTTLHIFRKYKDITYLQSGFRPWENVDKVEQMYHHFGDEVMMHLEFLRTNDAVTCSGLQIIRYSSEDRLNEIIQFHRDNGVHISNPHTYILEDGGKLCINPDQLDMKHRLDPTGLLNPGKIRSWDTKETAA